MEDADAEALIYTEPALLAKVRDNLTRQGLSVKTAELIRRPIVSHVVADKEVAGKALEFLERLEDMDDVQKVYANIDIPDDLLNQGRGE